MRARPNREFTSKAVAERLKEYLGQNYTLVDTLQGVETYTERPVDVEIYRINGYAAG